MTHSAPYDADGPTALQLARDLRHRERRSVELVEEALALAQRVDHLAPWVRRSPRRALAQARRFDQLLDRGADLPPLAGIPGGIKDIDPVALGRTQFGSRAFRWVVTPTDGPVAQRVRPMQPILGKLQTSELGVLPVTETDLHPPARNPWNPDRSPGGSSGGSAAAVASGSLVIAQGSDGGGSIRIPAAYCGLFGHKASRGLHASVLGKTDVGGLAVAGCLARDVEDAAAWMDGFLGRRYHPERPAVGSLLAQARSTPRSLRIRLVTDSPLAEVPQPWVDATLRAADVLRELGHDVVSGRMIDDISVDDFLPLYGYMGQQAPIIDQRLLQPATRFVRKRGEGWSWARAFEHTLELRRRVGAWWGDVDAVLSPTCGANAPRIGAWKHMSGEEAFHAAVPLGAFTAVYNIGGQAAASVPFGLDDEGMPVGFQLACRQGEDGLLLSLCRQVEQALSERR